VHNNDEYYEIKKREKENIMIQIYVIQQCAYVYRSAAIFDSILFIIVVHGNNN